MNCLHCSKQMYSYYDDEISPHLKLEIDRHLAECTSCRLQYDLTLAENQVLRNTSDIPEVSPDFNERVMNAIHADIKPNLPDNVLVMSKDKRLHFRWSSLYAKSAVAVLLLALCFCVPGLITGDQQEQKIVHNKPVDQKAQLKSVADCGSPMEKQSNIVIKAPNSDLSNVTFGNTGSLPPQTNLEFAIPKLPAGSRLALREAGRAERKEITSDTPSFSSLNLKNIPSKYKLLSQVNSAANQTDYAYQTDDGSATINISIISPPVQEQANVAETDAGSETVSDRMTMTAAPAASAGISRDIQVGDQTISVLISGNISIEELNALADNIVISKAPNI